MDNLGHTSAEKDIGVLTYSKLNMSQQCALAEKADNAVPGGIKSAAVLTQQV